MTDAVVVGAGPNGLVAANLLADAGWDVLVLEAQPEPGGAVRSDELVPGFVRDRFSAFYPLGYASPALRGLHLEQHGLVWRWAPDVLAHPTRDGRAALLSTDLDRTATSLDAYSPGDGDAWRELYALWQRVGPDLLAAVAAPFPPVRPGLRLARHLGLSGGVRFGRLALQSVRALADERFTGPGGGLLLAGNSLHADLPPEGAGSAVLGWLLAMLGQDTGWPVPEGGSGRLTDALVARLRSRGGVVECGVEVTGVVVRNGRAVGVRTAQGGEHPARRAVLADVDAPRLYLDLVGPEHLPASFVTDVRRFAWDYSTVKVDWALDGPVPWTAPEAARAGTVHLGWDLDELTGFSADLAAGRIPRDLFLLFGQMTTADPSRSPAGTESAWAYTHVPQQVRSDPRGALTGRWDAAESEVFADRMEARVEEFAPGFRNLIRARAVQSPGGLQDANGNLHRGALSAGSAALHQELLWRPTPGLGRPETPVDGLYLAGASASPGPGVHGGPGSAAARAALSHASPLRRGGAAGLAALHRRVQAGGAYR